MLFNDAALSVKAIEFGGDARRFRDIPFQQQAHAKISAPNASAGIDARPEHEAEMPGLRRPAEPCHIHQRSVTNVVTAAQRDQPLGNERAVQSCQHGDVSNSAKRHMMERVEQVGFRPDVAPEIAGTQFAVHRHQRHEDKTDGGEMTKTGQIVEPVRIDQRIDHRKLVAALVMVDHHYVHPEALRLRQRLDAGGATIDRDQERRAFVRKAAHGFDVRAIAFEDAVRNMDQRIETRVAQMPGQQRRRGGAIHVIVAENRNLLTARRRICDPLGGHFHVRHCQGIGQQLADGRIEKVFHRIDVDATPGDNPRQHFRHLIALCNRQCPRCAARIEPVAPDATGRRPLHTQKGGAVLDGQCGCRERHDAFRK